MPTLRRFSRRKRNERTPRPVRQVFAWLHYREGQESGQATAAEIGDESKVSPKTGAGESGFGVGRSGLHSVLVVSSEDEDPPASNWWGGG
jgi:hypothetical protein